MNKLILISALLNVIVNAQLTFTAIKDGNWSDAGTWDGLTAPGSTITLRSVDIPSGITVAMDTDVEMNVSLKDFNVDGVLDGAGYSLKFRLGALKGDGLVNIDSLNFGTGGELNLGDSAIVNCNYLTNQYNALSLDAGTINVDSLLLLQAGILTITGNATLNLSDNIYLDFNGGRIINTSGNQIGGNFNVRISGDADTLFNDLGTGNSNFRGLEIALDNNSDKIILGEDIIVEGAMNIVNGGVFFNGNALTIMGDLGSVKDDNFYGDESAKLIITGTGKMDTLHFANGYEQLGSLILDRDEILQLGSDIAVEEELAIQKGGIQLNGNFLFISGDFGQVADNNLYADESAQIVISGYGKVDKLMFAVGYDTLGSFIIDRDTLITIASNLTIKDSLILNNTHIQVGDSMVVELIGNLDIVDSKLELNPDAEMLILGDIGSINAEYKFNPNAEMLILGDIGDIYSKYYFDDNAELLIAGDFGNIYSDIYGHETAKMTITGNGYCDPLNFAAGYQFLGSLLIDRDTIIPLSSDLNISDSLILSMGKLKLDTAYIILDTLADIYGYDSSSYIITTSDGGVARYIENGDSLASVFPVGTESGYAPVYLAQDSGATSTYFAVGINEGILQDGYDGGDLSVTKKAVNKTWYIESEYEDDSVSVQVQFSWMKDMEVNGFNRDSAKLIHYYGSKWNTEAFITSHFDSATSTYITNSIQIKSLSPFGVIDSNADMVTTIKGQVLSTGETYIYPNPASGIININSNYGISYELYDSFGQLYKNEKLDKITQINTAFLSNGIYFVKVVYEKEVSDIFKILVE